MAHYCYVIVDNHPDITTTNIVSCSDPNLDESALNDDDDTLGLLLRDG